MLASSGVTRNTVIMYPTQEWSLYHRMGRVYYQNIWLQKKANCLRAIWNVQKHQYTLKGGIARECQCMLWKGWFCLTRLIHVAEWGTEAVATSSLSCRWTRHVNRQGSRGKEGSVVSFWWNNFLWEDPDLSSAVKAQVSAVAFLVSFLSAIF